MVITRREDTLLDTDPQQMNRIPESCLNVQRCRYWWQPWFGDSQNPHNVCCSKEDKQDYQKLNTNALLVAENAARYAIEISNRSETLTYLEEEEEDIERE